MTVWVYVNTSKQVASGHNCERCLDYSASPLALNTVTTLSVAYQMTQGTFGNGAAFHDLERGW